MSKFTVKNLLENTSFSLGLEVIAGKKGVDNEISSAKVQKLGLAMSGFTDHIHGNRIQTLGNTEMAYLRSLSAKDAKAAIDNLFSLKLCCMIVSCSLEVPAELIAAADNASIPLLRSPLNTDKLTIRLIKLLEEKLTETSSIHGVLVDVLGIGILILGKSGVGKSECALDLITKGHRLVADDMVVVRKNLPNIVLGSSPDLIRYHMEIRGLGIINIKDIFGNTAVRVEKQIDMVVKLVPWDPSHEYDRLGFDKETYQVLDVEMPVVRLPVTPGRNMTTIIEVAARNHILSIMGHNPALEFEKSLKEEILSKELE